MTTTLQVAAMVMVGFPIWMALFYWLIAWREDQGSFSRGAVWEVEEVAPAVAVAEADPVKLEATPCSRPSSLAERAWSLQRS